MLEASWVILVIGMDGIKVDVERFTPTDRAPVCPISGKDIGVNDDPVDMGRLLE